MNNSVLIATDKEHSRFIPNKIVLNALNEMEAHITASKISSTLCKLDLSGSSRIDVTLSIFLSTAATGYIDFINKLDDTEIFKYQIVDLTPLKQGETYLHI